MAIASSHGRYAFLAPFRRQVSSFRLEVTRRLKNLATKAFVVAHVYRPSLGAAAFSAVVMAIMLLLLRALKVVTFADYLLATLPDGPVDEWFGYLNGMNTWVGSWSSRVVWTFPNEFVSKFFSSFLGTGLLIQPLRSSAASFKGRHVTLLVNLVALIIVCYLIFAAVDSMLDGLIVLPFPWFPGIQISSAWMLVGIVVSGGFWMVLTSLDRRQTVELGTLVLESTIAVALALLPMVAMLLGLRGLPNASVVLLWVCAANITSLVMNCPWSRHVVWEKELGHEGIRFWRWLWKRKMVVLPVWKGARGRYRVVAASFVHNFLTVFLPILVVCVLAYPHLVRLNEWYLGNMGVLMENLRQLSDSAVERIAAGTWDAHTRLRFIVLYGCQLYVGPEGLLPSTAVCLLAAIIVLITSVVCLGITGLLGEPARIKFFERMPFLIELSRLLRHDFLTGAVKRSSIQKALARRPYLSGPAGIPLMRSTCDTIRSRHLLQIEHQRCKSIVMWVTKCASQDGGFGAMPGMEPDYLHTGAALQMCHDVGLSDCIDMDKHSVWLEHQIRREVCGSELRSAHEWLLATGQLVRGVAHTNGGHRLSQDLIKDLVQVVKAKWRSGHKCITCTHTMVKVLEQVNVPLTPDISDELYASWLPIREGQLPSFKPTPMLREISELVDIIASLYPDSYEKRPSITQVSDNLKKELGSQRQ